MFNRAYNNTDYRYKVHKLSVGKRNLKLKLQHSKRNNSKRQNKPNNLSINNDDINNSKIKALNYNNSSINNNKNATKEKNEKHNSSKTVNTRSKVLTISSNHNEIININNYFTNDNNPTESIVNNDISTNRNENENIENNSYIHITLNSNNPYNNYNIYNNHNNITNITEEKDEIFKDNTKKEIKEYENKISKKSISTDVRYNITVNKIINNKNNNVIGLHNNVNNNNILSKDKMNIKEHNKNRVIFKKDRRGLSVKHRQDNFSLNKKSQFKEKYNSNNDKKNYSPLLESSINKFHSKISCPINFNNNIHSNINYYSHNSQKTKNNLSNINTISFNNNNISNYNTNNANNANNANNTNNSNNTNKVNNTNHINTISNDEEFFEVNNDKNQELTKDEKFIYGDRMMKGYTKHKLLGKGGCGIVWLCSKENEQIFNSDYYQQNNEDNFYQNSNEAYYAVKQTSKKNGSALMNMAEENILTAKNEINILLKLNNQNNNDCIPKIYDYYEDINDIWFSFEKGGVSISGLSFKIKGEFEKGERIYFIQKGKFLLSLFSTISQFKYLLKSLLLGIDYINKKGIIHSDIKPENILIEYKGDSKENNFKITSIKIIDYGSALNVNNTTTISSNTPEYLCPEITTGNKKFIKDLKNNNSKYINCIDIWSLGITILELCLCCPIWMNYKTKIIINGKTYHSTGLFGCRGRDANKIYQKQVELCKGINKKLKNSMLYLFDQYDKENFIDLLKKMLELDYKKRITCQDAVNHPFFSN